MVYSSTVIMEAAGSGEYVPHSVACQKAVILMLNATKTTYLMAAVIFHIAFHKSHVRCLQIFATNVISTLYTVGGFPDGDDSAVRRRGKKSPIADSEEKVDTNSNSYKHLKFQIKPSDSIQTDFR